MPVSLLRACGPAGTQVGNVSIAAQDRFGVIAGCLVVSGQGWCAAFLATGAATQGDGVTRWLHARSQAIDR